MYRYFKKLDKGLARVTTAKGFTLTELIVSLGIVMAILAGVVFNQSTYLDGAALSNLVQELSSTITQAQAYGIAVRELSPGSEDFSASYGITLSILSSGSPTAYLFFADRNGNNFYDGEWACPLGGVSECLEKVNITRGNYIDSVCAIRSVGADQCNNISRIDISFIRPNTEAKLIFFNNSGALYNPPNMIGAKVVIKSPAGLERSVSVYQSGQISVQ